MRFRSFVVWALACLAALPVCAQPPATKSAAGATKTVLNVELLTGADGGALHAQDWRTVFEQLDVAVTIRRAVLDDKPDIKERAVGTLRYVTVIGQLDRQGRLVFTTATFTRADAAGLKEWLNDLKTYGSQGKPEGQPLWGLSKTQFEALYLALSERLEDELQGMTLDQALTALRLPAAYPVRWSVAAREHAAKLGERRTVRQSVAGFSKATALAIALNDRGLGFRPNRTPGGTLEVVIEPQSADRFELWPVGWPLRQQAPTLMPGLFVMTNIELKQESLADVLEAAADLTDAPILLNYSELDRRQVDVSALKASHPLKKTTWSLALRAILVPQKLNREYWQDESGRAFVWITPIGKERAPPGKP
jgi:hypothetical protein